ncbi:MAG: alpha/beta hydrolase family protein [Planctomycetota bacterium]
MRLLLLALPLLTGCMSFVPAASEPRAPRPLSTEVQARFAYVADLGSTTLVPDPAWAQDDELEVSLGTLPIHVPGSAADGDDGSFPVQFEYWRPRACQGGPCPAVVVTPILGGGSSLAHTNCEDFARAGYHVVLVSRGTRILRETWRVEDPERWMRKAIAARRAMLDWLATRPEVDSRRVAAFGISMGGIITSVLVAAEPRFRCGVVALAGGDLPGIIACSSEGRIEDFFTAKLKDTGLGPVSLEQRLRAAMPTDPLRVAQAVDARRVLQVTTGLDTIVPLEKQLLLWEALGRPARWHLPAAGHYSAILWLPWITDRVVEFFAQHLGAPGSPAPEDRRDLARHEESSRP